MLKGRATMTVDAATPCRCQKCGRTEIFHTFHFPAGESGQEIGAIDLFRMVGLVKSGKEYRGIAAYDDYTSDAPIPAGFSFKLDEGGRRKFRLRVGRNVVMARFGGDKE